MHFASSVLKRKVTGVNNTPPELFWFFFGLRFFSHEVLLF